MKFTVEQTIEGFVERWIDPTGDFDDFVPAGRLWQAMLHSAARPQDSKQVWGMTRKEAFEVMREIMPLIPRQQMKYCRAVPREPGGPAGYSAPSYERILLSEYAIEAMKMPLQVRRRDRSAINLHARA